MKKTIVILAILIFTTLAVYGFIIMSNFAGMEARGQFGDMFGAVNALFSGLAFLGVVYAILLQKEELGLQRKELELTRAELTRAAAAQESSGEALSRQAASLRITAKLNGLNTVLQYKSTLMQLNTSDRNGIVSPQRHRQLTSEIDGIIGEIKELTDDK